MFVGKFDHNLDSKFRLTVPAKMRVSLEDGMVITRSLTEPCLEIYPMEAWKEKAAEMESLPRINRDARKIRRIFFANAEKLELDKQGRIVISQRLRELSGINAEATLIGTGSFLEIWEPNNLDEFDDIDSLTDDVLNAFDI